MKKFLLLALLGCGANLYAADAPRTGEPIGLTCEHLVNPIGIDKQHPRLQWMLWDKRQGAKQSAYQIQLGTDSLAVLQNQGKIWDSGKIEQADMLVPYAGEALAPQTRYFWKVTAWDKDGQAHSSSVAAFETGIMHANQWKGTWISDNNDINHLQAPYFRKQFQVKKKIKSARAYMVAAGLFELSINGQRIGDHMLDPMYTRFDRRTLYVTHDVTKALQSGDNAIGVLLGNGWYNHQPLAVWDFDKAPWRNRPAFCMDLHIVYTDGSEETIVSQRDWKTSSGAIIANNIYTGEHYDARLEQKGWDMPGFDDSKWQRVRYRSAPTNNIVSQQIAPIRLVKTYEPISLKKFDEKTYLFDMGQNMAGITKLKVSGPAGTIVKITHGERLAENGRLDMSNIDVYYRGDKEKDPFQTDIVILDGEPLEFMPKFNYKGFRYVEVSSSHPISLDQSDMTAYFMHSDVKPTSRLQTSSKLVNKLWEITNNAYLSNLMGYPTDCPQREKNGWTGDGHLAIETAFYNFDGITVYEKWLADHRDEQQPNGVLPDIIPTGGWGYG
ncbi:MAG: family 78 glycoside hydrolase catalytic domain, partial [Sphingobacterium sp.]